MRHMTCKVNYFTNKMAFVAFVFTCGMGNRWFNVLNRLLQFTKTYIDDSIH